MTGAEPLFIDTNILIYANIVATMLVYEIPCLLTHNVKDFERFGTMIRIEGIDDGSS